MQDRSAPLTVGSNVRLRDGRKGKVTKVEGNRMTMTAEDGSTVEAPVTEAEPVDTGTEDAATT